MKYLHMKLILILTGILIGIGSAFVITRFSPYYKMQEYQIRLEPDSAYIYDNGRLVGSCAHGNDGIDSVLVMDNL